MRFIGPLLLLALLLALAWFNPSTEQFNTFLSEEVAARVGETAGEAGRATGFLTERLGRAAGDAIGRSAGREIAGRFERSNYLLASTYSLDLNGRREGGEWVFLGIAGQFVPLETPENLQTLIRDVLL